MARLDVALTRQPAGTVATRAAGLAEFRATLWWEEAPPYPPSCLPAPAAFFRHDLEEMPCRDGTGIEVTGTVRALSEQGLGSALGVVMRSVGDAAAASGAVLEMRALRVTQPRPAPSGLVQALALDLWRAGFDVGFAPCWDPLPPGVLALGAAGGESDLREFLEDHPRWDPRDYGTGSSLDRSPAWG